MWPSPVPRQGSSLALTTLRIFPETDGVSAPKTNTDDIPPVPGTCCKPPKKPPRTLAEVERERVSQSLPSAQATHCPHLLVRVFMDPFPSLLLLVCLLFLLLWEDVVNPGQVVLGENQVQEPSNNDKAQDLGWEDGQKGRSFVGVQRKL